MRPASRRGMDDRPTRRMLAVRELEPPPPRPFPHPPPPLVSDPAECTTLWKRPVYEPTLVLPMPAEEADNPESLPTAPETSAPLLASSAEPLGDRSHVRPISSESRSSLARRAGAWAVMVVLSALTGAATWLGLAHFGVT